MIAGRPAEDVPVPQTVRNILGATPAKLVWRNEVGGLTFEVSTHDEQQFLKWTPAASGVDLAREVVRLRWAAAFCTVPTVLAHGTDVDGSWLVTRALSGNSAVSHRWLADPARAVTAIGAGLRALHDTLPVALCPFTWSAAERVADAQQRAEAGLLDPADWHDVHKQLGVADALAMVADAPAVDDPVVCHGDACAPNTMISDTGRFVGHVDLGSLGTADRWADLAVATWSTLWNYGPGWELPLLDAYGIEPDPGRTAYYRLLWDLGP